MKSGGLASLAQREEIALKLRIEHCSFLVALRLMFMNLQYTGRGEMLFF